MERARIRQLEQWSADWERWRRERAFVVELRARASQQPLPAELEEWLHWAEDFVGRSDPVASLLVKPAQDDDAEDAEEEVRHL